MVLAWLAFSRDVFQAIDCLCVPQVAAAGVTGADVSSGHGRSHVISVHADTRATTLCPDSRHSSHKTSEDPTAARAPAPEGGASIAAMNGAAVRSGRNTYSRVALLALCTGCSALPLGAKAWPIYITRTGSDVGGAQAPVSALTMRCTGVMSASDAFGPSPAPRGATRPALGLKDATRSWLQLPRELPGALPAAFLTLVWSLTVIRCIQTWARCERCPSPTRTHR